MSKRLNNTVKRKLASYFMARLSAVNYRKGWMKSTCPHCGKPGKYGINLGVNRTNCFRCGAHPNPVSLVMDIEKLTTYEDFQRFILNYEGSDIHTYRDEASVELGSYKELEMPEGFILYGSPIETALSRLANKYALSRGFTLPTLRKLGWGYCDKGPLFGYMVIPFFSEGSLVYYNARKFIGNGPRYRNPDTDISGVGKSFLIYNETALYLYDKVYLCEGAINAVTLGEKAISMGGKSVSRYQINKVITSSVDKVVIVLDPDAMDKALDLAIKLSEFKKVKVVKLPEGKDINDLGRKVALEYIRETPYSSYNELCRMKQRNILSSSIKLKL